MKTILPWILAVAFAAGAGALYFSSSADKAELTKVREQAQQAETLRTQLDEAKNQASTQTEQMESLRKDNEELLRLRNEVRQLRDQKQQLDKQLQTSQAQVERTKAEVQQVQVRASENANAIAEQRILQMKQTQQATATCVNSLRQLQAAKQQWALENNKTVDSLPLPQDILVYLPNQQMPQCPGGGRYTLNVVGAVPTCTIPGHALQ